MVPPAPVHERDVAMSKAGEMLHRLGRTLVVGGPDHIDGRARHPAADHDDGKLLAKGTNPVGLVLGPEQDQRLAPGVEQDLRRPALVPGRRHDTEHQVVTQLGGGRVDVGGELGVKGIPYVHQHAEMMTAPPGQQAGRPVGAVAQFPGGLEHPAPGRLARAGLVPEHERH